MTGPLCSSTLHASSDLFGPHGICPAVRSPAPSGRGRKRSGRSDSRRPRRHLWRPNRGGAVRRQSAAEGRDRARGGQRRPRPSVYSRCFVGQASWSMPSPEPAWGLLPLPATPVSTSGQAMTEGLLFTSLRDLILRKECVRNIKKRPPRMRRPLEEQDQLMISSPPGPSSPVRQPERQQRP